MLKLFFLGAWQRGMSWLARYLKLMPLITKVFVNAIFCLETLFSDRGLHPCLHI